MVVGAIGVGLLLVAFIANLTGWLNENHAVYLSLNIIGCALAAWYAASEGSIPFIVLEAVWGAAALIKLTAVTRKRLSVQRKAL